jgi:hypothetical protein
MHLIVRIAPLQCEPLSLRKGRGHKGNSSLAARREMYYEEYGMVEGVNNQEALELLDRFQRPYEERSKRHLPSVSRSPYFLGIDTATRRFLKKRDTEIEFDKMVFWGIILLNFMMAKITTAVLGKPQDTLFFDTHKETLSWLTKKQPMETSVISGSWK